MDSKHGMSNKYSLIMCFSTADITNYDELNRPMENLLSNEALWNDK